MEESLTGFIRTGGWVDVVEHGERVTTALVELDVDSGEYSEAVSRWDEWRPKTHERLREDVNEKTASEASVAEGPGEELGATPDDDIKHASRMLSESVEDIERGRPSKAFEKWRDSLGYTARAADSSWRKLLRPIESFIYKHLMTAVSPYYFDSELISANITRHPQKFEYTFEINISDDCLREDIREKLEAYEDVPRWHVATKLDTTPSELVEGVDDHIEEDGEEIQPSRNIGDDALRSE